MTRTLLVLAAWMLLAAGAGAADVFREGGDAYKKGDYETAAAKFLEVAEKGDHRAMYALGSMYAAGRGVEKDYRQAYKWFSSAARYNRPDAEYKLGLMYDEGIGIRQNAKLAARWYNRAARQSYPDAQFRLGLLYAQGRGVRLDDTRAYAWLTVAKQNYLQRAGIEKPQADAAEIQAEQRQLDAFADIHLGVIETSLQEIGARLGPEQFAEAESLARELAQER